MWLSAATLRKTCRKLVRTGVIVALGDLKPGVAKKGGVSSQPQWSIIRISFFISPARHVCTSERVRLPKYRIEYDSQPTYFRVSSFLLHTTLHSSTPPPPSSLSSFAPLSPNSPSFLRSPLSSPTFTILPKFPSTYLSTTPHPHSACFNISYFNSNISSRKLATLVFSALFFVVSSAAWAFRSA
jgi:hypothetical protein